MSSKKVKYVLVAILATTVLTIAGVVVYKNLQEVFAATSNTSVTVNNSSPTFSVAPAEQSPSYGTDVGQGALNVGLPVTFLATGTDSNSDDYYLIVCRTNAVNPGDGAAPTCASVPDRFCVTGAITSGTATSCNYTALVGDSLESYAWFAFVCDGVSGGGACSSVNQGSGNSGSPVYINHAPAFSNAITDGAKDPGIIVNFQTTASDGDTEGGGSDTVKLVVCADTSGATYAGCSGTQLCASADSASNPTCGYTIPSPTDNGAINYYAYIFDNHQLGSSDNYRSGTYTVNNVAPVVSNVVVNSASPISLTENTTTAINVTGTITDQNSCQDIVTVQTFMYMDPTNDYVAGTCDAAADADNNDCYAEVSCTVSGGSCTGATDASADYTCQVNMQFHSNPTATAGDSTDPTYHATDDWKATIKAIDSGLTATLESAAGVEVNKTLGMSINTGISYGNLSPGSDTGTTLDSNANLTTTVEATGNVGMDLSFGGSLMCTDYPTCTGTTIPIANQEYYWTGSSFAWGTGTNLLASGAEEEVNIGKTTITGTKANKKALWGVGLPGVLDAGTYTGINTITSYIGESANW